MLLKKIKKAVRETDMLFFSLCVLLSVIGVVMVQSATVRGTDAGSLISRDARVMILALILGAAASLVISFIDFDLIFKLSPLIALGSLLLMFLLFTPLGVSPEGRADAVSWLKITSTLYFQPSEILKIAFIITFSIHLGKVKNNISSPKNVLFLCLHAALPILLVVKSGDMGSALIFVLMFVGMLFTAGLHRLYFPAGIFAVAAASPVVWFKVFDDIQRNRILALFNPEKYPTQIYQQQQALNAMKEGGFFGTGLFKGTYTQSGSIPVDESDMVFSVICEETGFVCAAAVLLIFLLLAIRIMQVGKRSGNFQAYMLCSGVMFMLAAQVIVNIGMCTMLLPVIGITLPFISAGGSSVICVYLAVGLVMSVYRSSQGLGYDDFRYARIARQYY